MNKKFSVAIICGGPSPEAGISLNSARSVMDHLIGLGIEVVPIYVNSELEFFRLETKQLYSNTPSDFNFKLKVEDRLLNVVNLLREVNLVFPVIHGKYGEDGGIQSFLEYNQLPFVGSTSESCKNMFSKSNVNKVLCEHNFDVTIMNCITRNDINTIKSMLNVASKVVVKPNACGSSIGVSVVENLADGEVAVHEILSNNLDEIAVVEEFCDGEEFTVIVLQNVDGEPIALIPTQINILSMGEIFDYRKKYLPTNATRWYCPPKFSDTIISRIRNDAERIFRIFGARDCIRIDGWLLKDGRLIFSDINPVSGMEQNSFLFQQAAVCGMTHSDVLKFILKNACNRYGMTLPNVMKKSSNKRVFVLFGGNSPERQVSLMSGTNVWLKLLNSKEFSPTPCFLYNESVWLLPYNYTLNHTVEEIQYNCENAIKNIDELTKYVLNIRTRLGLTDEFKIEIPQQFSMNDFLNFVKLSDGFVFLGLHGGIGEDGTIQNLLEKHSILYNGSNSTVSKLCMNKYLTGKVSIPGVTSLNKILCKIVNNKLIDCNTDDVKITYNQLKRVLNDDKFIIKPSNDGCSSGVIQLYSQHDIDSYTKYVSRNANAIPSGVLSHQKSIIELPENASQKEYIIEKFIEVDHIRIVNNQLKIEKIHGWVEMTVGIIEMDGSYYSLNPSVTVASNNVLSLEEKFQGGTGINLTPPPSEVVDNTQINVIKNAVQKIGEQFKLQQYARVDIFFNRFADEIILIEINTLPALTPSTVIFHQLLAEKQSVYPRDFLESLCSKKFNFMV